MGQRVSLVVTKNLLGAVQVQISATSACPKYSIVGRVYYRFFCQLSHFFSTRNFSRIFCTFCRDVDDMHTSQEGSHERVYFISLPERFILVTVSMRGNLTIHRETYSLHLHHSAVASKFDQIDINGQIRIIYTFLPKECFRARAQKRSNFPQNSKTFSLKFEVISQ